MSEGEGAPPMLRVPLVEIAEIRGNAAVRDEFLLASSKVRLEYKATNPAEADDWCRVGQTHLIHFDLNFFRVWRQHVQGVQGVQEEEVEVEEVQRPVVMAGEEHVEEALEPWQTLQVLVPRL